MSFALKMYRVPDSFPDAPRSRLQKGYSVYFDMGGFMKQVAKVEQPSEDERWYKLYGTFDESVYFAEEPEDTKLSEPSEPTSFASLDVIDAVTKHFDEVNDFVYVSGNIEAIPEDVKLDVPGLRYGFRRTEPRVLILCSMRSTYYGCFILEESNPDNNDVVLEKQKEVIERVLARVSAREVDARRARRKARRARKEVRKARKERRARKKKIARLIKLEGRANFAAEKVRGGTVRLGVMSDEDNDFDVHFKQFDHGGYRMLCASWELAVSVRRRNDHSVCMYAICGRMDASSFTDLLNSRVYMSGASDASKSGETKTAAANGAPKSGDEWQYRLYCLDANESLSYTPLESLNKSAQESMQESAGLWDGICMVFSMRAIKLSMMYCERLYGGNALRYLLRQADELFVEDPDVPGAHKYGLFPLLGVECAGEVFKRFSDALSENPYLLDDSDRLITTGLTPMKEVDRTVRYNDSLIVNGDFAEIPDGVHTLDLSGLLEFPEGLCAALLDSSVTTLICPPVKSLAEGMFEGCRKLCVVGGLHNVSEIGARAFYGCESLRVVQYLVKCVTMGKSAFEGCRVWQMKLPVIKTFWGKISEALILFDEGEPHVVWLSLCTDGVQYSVSGWIVQAAVQDAVQDATFTSPASSSSSSSSSSPWSSPWSLSSSSPEGTFVWRAESAAEEKADPDDDPDDAASRRLDFYNVKGNIRFRF